MKKNSCSISVVIPLLGGTAYISPLFDALKKQTLRPSEIIFVISRVGDWRTAKKLVEQQNFTSIRPIIIEPAFPGAARNIGAKEAYSNWIAFLDIRTLPAHNWLENMLATANKGSYDLISSKMICSAKTFFHHLLQASTYGNNAVECLPGSIVKKSLFLDSGGFLENVRAGEDWEWINRFAQKNKFIQQEEIVIFYHGLPNNIFQLIKKWFIYSFENSKVNILLKEKFSYMGLAFFIFAILLYRWNHIVSGEVWNEDALLFIPNLNKIFWSVFFFFYFLYRGIFKPISDKVALSFLLPFSWIFVGALGLLIDLVKAPGRVHGSVKYLISHFQK